MPLMLLAVGTVFLAACSSKQGGGQKVAGTSLTVFSSMPLDGPTKEDSENVVRGEKLALWQADSKVGKFTIKFGSLNNANGKGWDRRLTADNARKAVREGRTIAYIGELDSAASSVAIPILNQEDLLGVSPTSTAVGLTKVFPGARAGEPDRYYPSGKRNFVRLIATDDVLANAAAQWANDTKTRRAVVFSDGSAYGTGLAKQFESKAKEIGLKTTRPRGVSVNQASTVNYKSGDLVFYGGEQSKKIATIFKAINKKSPQVSLMASSSENGVIDREFYSNLGEAGPKTRVVSAILSTEQLTKSGRKFLSAYKKKFKRTPDSYAAYGYASMKFVLNVLKRAGKDENDRLKVVEEAFDTEDYKGIFGTFSIDENGDSTIKKIAGYRVREGAPVFSADLEG